VCVLPAAVQLKQPLAALLHFICQNDLLWEFISHSYLWGQVDPHIILHNLGFSSLVEPDPEFPLYAE
jgi:hypothetical protein